MLCTNSVPGSAVSVSSMRCDWGPGTDGEGSRSMVITTHHAGRGRTQKELCECRRRYSRLGCQRLADSTRLGDRCVVRNLANRKKWVRGGSVENAKQELKRGKGQYERACCTGSSNSFVQLRPVEKEVWGTMMSDGFSSGNIESNDCRVWAFGNVLRGACCVN